LGYVLVKATHIIFLGKKVRSRNVSDSRDTTERIFKNVSLFHYVYILSIIIRFNTNYVTD